MELITSRLCLLILNWLSISIQLHWSDPVNVIRTIKSHCMIVLQTICLYTTPRQFLFPGQKQRNASFVNPVSDVISATQKTQQSHTWTITGMGLVYKNAKFDSWLCRYLIPIKRSPRSPLQLRLLWNSCTRKPTTAETVLLKISSSFRCAQSKLHDNNFHTRRRRRLPSFS